MVSGDRPVCECGAIAVVRIRLLLIAVTVPTPHLLAFQTVGLAFLRSQPLLDGASCPPSTASTQSNSQLPIRNSQLLKYAKFQRDDWIVCKFEQEALILIANCELRIENCFCHRVCAVGLRLRRV